MKHLVILMTLFASFLLNPVVAAEEPNIVYLLADDLGYGDIGSYGQRLIATPRMDRMAEQGMRFTDHYAGGSACHPLRCVLFTGMQPGHSFIRGNSRIPLRAEKQPVPSEGP